MATAEYLLKYIEANKKYDELPARLKLAVTEDDWARRVKHYCIHRGFAWASSAATDVVPEHEYYETLLSYYRTNKRIFPYHLAEYICRVMRVTPFKYYRDILADAMRDDLPYDAVPNFAAADALRVLGVGRNEYIAIMVQAKSKKLLWRMNKGIVKDLLPAEPKAMDPEPWWTVNLVNLSEPEYRSLTRAELDICQAAAKTGGARCDTVNAKLVNYLYRRGLVWFDVPVVPEDHLSIPPLEGFVSNKTAGQSDQVDPLETLMYQIFVAASDRVTVAKLASILNVNVETLAIGISVACRLKFCRRLLPGSTNASLGLPNPMELHQESLDAVAAGALASLDLDSVLAGGNSSVGLPTMGKPAAQGLQSGSQFDTTTGQSGTGIALVVDAAVTGFLMMGALTPAVKKHSVTLFEGGRVYGTQVINELVQELHASVELAAGFEGEMADLAGTAAALAVVLECVKASSGGRPIELLRKESLENLEPTAAFRILSHSYNVVLPVAGLPNPPLPLSIARKGPTNYGPVPAATTPWMQLALYKAAKKSPLSLVLPAGTRLARLPVELHSAKAVLVWPWNAAAVRATPSEPLIVDSAALLYILNHLLSKTALLVQPDHSLGTDDIKIINVPLPLVARGGDTKEELSINNQQKGTEWANFEVMDAADETQQSKKIATRAVGFYKDGVSEEICLPEGCVEALESLGLHGSVGCLRLMRCDSDWVPLSIVLGVPLAPLQLCKAVCSSASNFGFLESAACREHADGQRALHASLMALTAQHGARDPLGDVDADLDAQVPLPIYPLQVDHCGRVDMVHLSSGTMQGLSLLHPR